MAAKMDIQEASEGWSQLRKMQVADLSGLLAVIR